MEMKYGILLFNYMNFSQNGCIKCRINIGDDIQSYAVKKIYQKMGIPKEDIIEINEKDLTTWRGEYVVVIMNYYGGIFSKLEFSPYIIPVFCGYNNAAYIDDITRATLKKYEPIGCRDEQTLKNVRRAGIEAFLSGCATITLDKRTIAPKDGKVFFVDTPDSLEKYVPLDMLPRREVISHYLDEIPLPLDKEKTQSIFEETKRRLEWYKKEAILVVTSRLHCAAPCLAMGIPVIVVKTNVDINMSWFDKFVHIYTEDEFPVINWDVKAVEIEALKKQIIDVFAEKVKETVGRRKTYYDLSIQYESRKYSAYNQKLNLKLEKIVRYIGKENFRYALWGIGDGGNIAYGLIQEKYPKANCIVAVDRYKKGVFYESKIELPEALRSCVVDYIFVTTYEGRKEATELLSAYNKKKGKDWDFLISRVNGADEYFDGI